MKRKGKFRFYSVKYQTSVPGRYFNAHSDEMFELLGFPGRSKWPSEGVPAQVVQGIKVWVEPAPALVGPPLPTWCRPRKSSKHRVMCECPGCSTVVSAGRLFQHLCPEG